MLSFQFPVTTVRSAAEPLTACLNESHGTRKFKVDHHSYRDVTRD
jgi:hypothetical protein